MNNWRRFKEKLTVWVIRFSTEARLKYWGLTNLSLADAKNVVGLLQVSSSLFLEFILAAYLYCSIPCPDEKNNIVAQAKVATVLWPCCILMLIYIWSISFMCYGKLCATEPVPFQAFMQEHIDWPVLDTCFLGLMALPCEQDS